jgi:Collagen triple helix repeat (20 copies)
MRARTGLLAIGGAIALTIGGGTAYAAIAASPVSSSGVIDGCYTNAEINGSHVFVLQDQGTACPKGSTAISWSQTGPAGAQGPQGIQGPTGAAGAAGATGAIGPAGPAGPTGAIGPTGATGAAGPAGPAGAAGMTGPAGASVLTSASSPSGSCTNGDTDIDIANGEVYTCGSSESSEWGDTGSSIQGPPGQNGTNGTNGNTVLNGTGPPGGAVGNNGDFYIDTQADVLYGPKAGGLWLTPGTSLVGPAGPAGPAGPQGPAGAGGVSSVTDFNGIACTTDGGAVGTVTTATGSNNAVSLQCAASASDTNCTHSDGLGQTYQDCNDLLGTPDEAGTYNSGMGFGAQQAYTQVNDSVFRGAVATECGGSAEEVQTVTSGGTDEQVLLWEYAGPFAGYVHTEPAADTSDNTLFACPTSSDPTWT